MKRNSVEFDIPPGDPWVFIVDDRHLLNGVEVFQQGDRLEIDGGGRAPSGTYQIDRVHDCSDQIVLETQYLGTDL